MTDANNHTTSYAYDSRNRLTTITDASATPRYMDTIPEETCRPSPTDWGTSATTLYDALNRATTMISAVSGTTTITYDAAGRETSLTDPVGNKTQWAYDADDRVTTRRCPTRRP